MAEREKRSNIKLSPEGLRMMQSLKKPGESYNKMAERLYCKNNPKTKKCKRGGENE